MENLKSRAEKLGLELTREQLGKFSQYYLELIEWNQRLNLTAITTFKEVYLKHFLDSLTVISAGELDEGVSVIDVGAGAGLPGLPLKIARPDIKLSLLESTAKKVRFLAHLKKSLGLGDVEIICGRAEEVARNESYREGFDIALSRAVAPLATLVELTIPFIKVGGRLIAQKKGDIELELKEAEPAIRILGGVLLDVKPIELIELGRGRYLVIVGKLILTPTKYPRRPGVPAKRPIC
jgi:16S rRNA (guanine527-N7)-methyltransferase